MKLEEGGLSSSPGVVLYPAYCLLNHACRWPASLFTFCNTFFTSLSLDFYSVLLTYCPSFLWLHLKKYLVGVDLLFQQQHELPEVARLEAGVEVAGGDKEGGGDLDQVRLRFI